LNSSSDTVEVQVDQIPLYHRDALPPPDVNNNTEPGEWDSENCSDYNQGGLVFSKGVLN
jgi:hypothetical protein